MLLDPGNRPHLRVAHSADFRRLRCAGILATRAPVLNVAPHFQRPSGRQPGWRGPVTPDRLEPASWGNAIGRTGLWSLQLDLSFVDNKSRVAVDDVDLVTFVLCFETKSPEKISALGLLIDANARVGEERKITAFSGHSPGNVLDALIIGETLAHGGCMVVMAQGLEIRQVIAGENRLKVPVATEDNSQDVGKALRVHPL